MVQGQVFLKQGEGSWHFFYLIFSRFIIFSVRDYSLQNCYAFEEKSFFSATIILQKKSF